MKFEIVTLIVIVISILVTVMVRLKQTSLGSELVLCINTNQTRQDLLHLVPKEQLVKTAQILF